MDKRIPTLEIKIMLESSPLKSQNLGTEMGRTPDSLVRGTGGATQCGQFSEFHACFCGLDPGNLKFETVRTNKQHICF